MEAELFGRDAEVTNFTDIEARGRWEKLEMRQDLHNLTSAEVKRPAWTDPDDDRVQLALTTRAMTRKLRESETENLLSGRDYEARLRHQHEKLHPRSAVWSSAKDVWKDNVSDLFQTAGGNLDEAGRLPPGKLETTRLKDANHEEPCQSVVNSVEFHPSGQLFMAAGLDRHVRFFNIDGVENQRVQSIFLEDMPVHKAAFTQGGSKVLVAGRRSWFYVLDLETAKLERGAGVFGRKERSLETFTASPASEVVAFFGQDGSIPLVSMNTRQAVGSLKMNGTVRAGSISADGRTLYTSGSDGIIYVWDLRMQQCRQRYVDEGSTGCTSLATSPDRRTFVSGSSSGVVNVYQPDDWPLIDSGGQAVKAPRVPIRLPPLKTLPHLVTLADTLAFGSDGEVLAIASRMKRDSLRLIHMRSMTAFSNWPTSRTPLHYVHSACFSPGMGYLAIGNAKGRVLLYRLHHYPQC